MTQFIYEIPAYLRIEITAETIEEAEGIATSYEDIFIPVEDTLTLTVWVGVYAETPELLQDPDREEEV